jgi:hypothetical protein
MLKRPLRPRSALATLATLAALAFPAAAQAVKVEIDNQSGREVWLTVVSGEPGYEVTGADNGVPKKLSELDPPELDVGYIDAGRIYISFGAPVTEFDAETLTRYGWIELNEKHLDGDVVNLTAVDQFGIGMQLDNYSGGEQVESLGSAYADTIFAAMQAIPGGPAATVRNGGEIVRVLSPTHTDAYPDLGEYVRSMAGKTIHLHSTFSGPGKGEFTTSAYSGSFEADGSIVLNGTSEGPQPAPAEITMDGPELIEDIYTGANTPNDLAGQIRHDVLVGFMAGYWDGRYGNDAIDFCQEKYRKTDVAQPYCEVGFNQPAFAAARTSPAPFPAFEQYAGVIDQYADMYGNPYSDGAAGAVTIPVNKSGSREIDALKLTIMPDSPAAPPAGSGPSPAPAPPPAARRAGIHTKLLRHARLRRGKLRVARVACSAPCGRIRAVVRVGKRIVARSLVKRAGRKRLVVARLTRPGRRLMRHRRKLKARLDLWVAPRGHRAVHRRAKLLIQR